jgi:hypothetical protein
MTASSNFPGEGFSLDSSWPALEAIRPMADDTLPKNRFDVLDMRSENRCLITLISSEASYAVLTVTMQMAMKADAMVIPAICAQHDASHDKSCTLQGMPREYPPLPCAHLIWPFEPHDPLGTVQIAFLLYVVEKAHEQCNNHDDSECKLRADRGEKVEILKPIRPEVQQHYAVHHRDDNAGGDAPYGVLCLNEKHDKACDHEALENKERLPPPVLRSILAMQEGCCARERRRDSQHEFVTAWHEHEEVQKWHTDRPDSGEDVCNVLEFRMLASVALDRQILSKKLLRSPGRRVEHKFTAIPRREYAGGDGLD